MFDGEGDYRLEPEDPGECPHHRGHEPRACERCDWEPIDLALDEALEAFDALGPSAPEPGLLLESLTRAALYEHDPWAPPFDHDVHAHEENDTPIAAE